MKQVVRFTLLCLWSIAAILYHPQPTSAENAERPRLKAGAILPLTGDFARVGKEIHRGMLLALDDFAGKDIELIVEDDASLDNTKAVTALQKLVNVDRVHMVFNSSSDTIAALAPVLNQRAVPGVIVWDTFSGLSTFGNYVYGMGYSTEYSGNDMAAFAVRKLQVKSVAVVSAEGEWSERISTAFIEKFKQLSGRVTTRERVQASDTDFRSLIMRLRRKNPDAVYLPLYYSSIRSFIRQARELGFKGAILCGNGLTVEDAHDLGSLAEGIYSTNLWLEDERLRSLYRKRWGNADSPTYFAYVGMGYDAIKLAFELKQELDEEVSAISSGNLHATLPGFWSEGVTGMTQFSYEGIAQKRERILIVRDGRFQEL